MTYPRGQLQNHQHGKVRPSPIGRIHQSRWDGFRMMLRTFSIREELLNNFRAAFARMWVRLRGANRDPISLVAEIGLPILTIGAYVILYKAIGFPSTAGAAVIIGGAMVAFWT